MEEDWRLVCRTCLASDAEFYKLDAPIISEDDEEKVSFMECLRYCTHLEDMPQFPIYICVECSAALQMSYAFIRCALDSHTILRQKLCPSYKSNTQHITNIPLTVDSEVRAEKVMRYRCKICGEKVDSKRSLKEHVKVHLDIISYNCQICEFESKKRSQLCDHYNIIHSVQPTLDQLKPKTNTQITNIIKTEDQVNEVYKEINNIQNLTTLALPEQQIQYTTIPPHWETGQMTNVIQHNVTELERIMDAQQFNLHHNLTEQLGTQLLEQQLATDIDDIKNVTTAQLNELSNEFNLGNELSIGNEFVVMSDGTVEEVMGNGVVIEYIDAVGGNVTLDNNLVLNNIVQVGSNGSDMLNMDIDDIIIEENTGAEINEENTNYNTIITTPTVVETTKIVGKFNCKVCPETCNTHDDLKSHMLIHNEISDNLNGRLDLLNTDSTGSVKIVKPPVKKIKCKICAEAFITQDELKNHMLTHNEIPHFFCDQCSFYTFFKDDLTQHYKTKHKLQPTQKQLLPKNRVKLNQTPSPPPANIKQQVEQKHIYICDMCLYETDIRANLCRHYLVKHQVEASDVQLRPSIDEAEIEQEHITVRNIKSARAVKSDYPNGIQCKKCNKVFYTRAKLKEHYKEHSLADCIDTKKLKFDNSTICDMDIDESISNTATIASIPADAVPQIVETDNIVDDIDFDFNGDVLFEDFDDEIENDDIEDILLTSDDDFEDLLEEQGQDTPTNIAQQPYCVYCNKKFFSQYQFENHMFVHRGLAPYRCEMCTNLYNTKRALIKHYKAIHDTIPTRDMIQAKGDIVTTENTPISLLNLEEKKTMTLMCGKCPVELTDLAELKNHLKEKHETTDEKFILQKLPFECPRCIRSFATKNRLVRHLERSHSLESIMQQHQNVVRKQAVNKVEVPNKTTCSMNCGKVNANLVKTQSQKLKLLFENEVEVDPIEEQLCNKSQLYANITEPTGAQATLVTNMKQHITSTTAGAATTKIVIKKDIESACTKSYNQNIALNVSNTLSTYADSTQNPKQLPAEERNNNTKNHCKSEPDVYYTNIDDTLHGSRNITTTNTEVESIKRFVCEVCNGSYKSLTLLKYHRKRHMERQYRCNLCPKSFVHRHELQQHTYTHTGEKLHKCEICSARFRYSFHLKRHMDEQHYGKRYACTAPGCGKDFKHNFQLKIHAWNHITNHNGNLPYKCNVCNAGFKSRTILREHARIKHNKKLSNIDIDKIFQDTLGCTNPLDLNIKTE